MSRRKERTRKLSIALIIAMVVSLMAPVLALAAMQASFTYDLDTGMLSGSVYVQDPNAVAVSVIKQDQSVTPVAYSNQFSSSMYDDQNNNYSSVTYSVYVGEAPATVKVQNGSEIFDIKYLDTGASSASSVTLDVYRMQGNLLLPNLLAEGSYIAAGSDLFDFTPNVAGADVLELIFPHNYLTHGTIDNIAVSDFVIENVTVGQAVYVDQPVTGGYWSPYDAEYKIRLQMTESFHVGNQYKVKLSDDAVDKIRLPNIKSDMNDFTAVVTTGTMSTLYDKKNSIYFKDIQLSVNPGDSGNPGGGGGGYV